MKTSVQKLIKFLKRAAVNSVLFLLVLVIIGTVYQTAATEADRRNFPPPGNLIDVGGFKMHIYCVGTGSPTVILEALSGGFSAYWGWVQPEVAKQVREYAAMYPQEVAGIVLLDSSHPDQFVRYPEMLKNDTAMLSKMPLFQMLLRLGVGHAYFALGGEMDFADLPKTQHDEIAATGSSPDYWKSVATTMVLGPTIFQQAHDLGSLGNLPLAVITRGEGVDTGWRAMQIELTALSTNSIHITVDGSTHTSLIFNPQHAHTVSETILQVVDAVRTGKPLKQ